MTQQLPTSLLLSSLCEQSSTNWLAGCSQVPPPHWQQPWPQCPLPNSIARLLLLPPCSVRHVLRLGVKVGLGTDVAGGYSPSMLSAIRAAVLASKALHIQVGASPLSACSPARPGRNGKLRGIAVWRAAGSCPVQHGACRCLMRKVHFELRCRTSSAGETQVAQRCTTSSRETRMC